MGLFHHKTKTVYMAPAFIADCRKFIDQQIADLQKNKSPEIRRREVRYSIAAPSYDGERVSDMKRFMSEAQKDTALFASRALLNTYHEWEKEAGRKKTFSSEVLKRIDELHLKPSEFYKAAEIDKRVFHSLKSDYLYTPSKSTAIRCCLGLRLSFEEAAELMKLAGYSFSPSNPQELAVRFCLENEVYDLSSVNYLLDALGERPLI